jgi:hypothetical protein
VGLPAPQLWAFVTGRCNSFETTHWTRRYPTMTTTAVRELGEGSPPPACTSCYASRLPEEVILFETSSCLLLRFPRTDERAMNPVIPGISGASVIYNHLVSASDIFYFVLFCLS